MPTDLSLVPLNDLVAEIAARYSSVFILGHANTTATDVESIVRISGDPFLILGLLRVHMRKLEDRAWCSL